MATLLGTDLILLNRDDQTYKGTLNLVAEFVSENLNIDPDVIGGAQMLNDLGDVQYAAGINTGDILIYDGASAQFKEASLRSSVEVILATSDLNVAISIMETLYSDET